MFALVSPEKIQLPAGSVVRLPATWQDYQSLCDRRGDGSHPRLKYRNGEVLLMSPLLVHGKDAHLIASIVTTLLDWDGREYDGFTPVTMTLPEESGIEPDYCFYINNWQTVCGKKRIDWQNDPPPDLVIEIDVTSYSDVQDYLPYQVPEVWLFKQQQLLIYQLQGAEYQLQTQSLYFPDFDLQSAMARCIEIAYQRNTSAAIRDLKQQLGELPTNRSTGKNSKACGANASACLWHIPWQFSNNYQSYRAINVLVQSDSFPGCAVIS